MRILTLPPNTKGRDFVCGDIHGSYSCVIRFLELINFDFENDRFICAGDLIDRGPENEQCLELLYEPWFFCAMGNHEHMMVHFSTGQPYGAYWSGNGGSWGTRYFKFWRVDHADGKYELQRNPFFQEGDVTVEKLMDFVNKTCHEKVKDLPYLITVEGWEGCKKFHVLHAELPPSFGEISDAMLADPAVFEKIASVQSYDGDYITWGRWAFAGLHSEYLDDRAVGKYRKMIEMHGKKFAHLQGPELSDIYSGHTVVRRPVQIYKQTNLDTKAYGSYEHVTRFGPQAPDEWCGLTVTEPASGRFWLVNDREFKEVTPIRIV